MRRGPDFGGCEVTRGGDSAAGPVALSVYSSKKASALAIKAEDSLAQLNDIAAFERRATYDAVVHHDAVLALVIYDDEGAELVLQGAVLSGDAREG